MAMVTTDQTLSHLRRRAAAESARAQARADQLRLQLPVAAQLLRERYGATAVVCFGSMVRESVQLDSDVDLAVRGLPPEQYFAALADLMAVFGAPVDLVQLERAPRSLRERIDAEGVPL